MGESVTPRPLDVLLRHILGEVGDYFVVERFFGRPPAIILVGNFVGDAATASAALRARLAEYGYYLDVAALPRGKWVLEVSPRPFRRARRRWFVNAVLFIATVFTTAAAGTMLAGGDVTNPADWPKGIPFSASLLTILLCHEMGHFVASRIHKVQATLPYFIPFPNAFGTFGALIRMESPIPDRRALLDIGVAGPLAGFVVSLPVTVLGLKLSAVVGPAGLKSGAMVLGDSLLFKLLTFITKGPIGKGDILLHPLALAGWIGLFVTAVNLLPIGQLDGGHVSYALFGRHSIWVARGAFLTLIPLGFVWNVWFFWALLIILFVRLGHPPPLDDEVALDLRRKFLGWTVLLIFVLTFIPAPIRIIP